MSSLRELLDRFRPAAAPGAAGPVGVPADRRAATAAELEPIFAALAEVQTAAAAIRLDGRDRADRKHADAVREAQVIVARARLNSRSVREDAAVQVRHAAQAELANILASADRAAAEVRDLGRQRTATVREGVTDLVRMELNLDRPVTEAAT